MTIATSLISISNLARTAVALVFLALPTASQAQNDPINGAIGGAAQGTYEGKTAAGPVGGLVGGAVGAGVGAVTGTLNGVLGVTQRAVEPIVVPPPPNDVPRGSYDSNGNYRPN